MPPRARSAKATTPASKPTSKGKKGSNSSSSAVKVEESDHDAPTTTPNLSASTGSTTTTAGSRSLRGRAAAAASASATASGTAAAGGSGSAKKRGAAAHWDDDDEDVQGDGDGQGLDGEGDDDDGSDSGEGVTRCVCGQDSEELSMTMMIRCDTCKCWQHGSCVGLWEEKDCPDRYFCELCRPGWHGPGGILRKAHRKVSSSQHGRSPSASLPASNASASAPVAAPSTTTSGTNAPSTTSGRKPRESADSAIANAFLLAEQVLPPSPGRGEGGPGASNTAGGAASGGGGASGAGATGASGKKRSTMNSRDAAYDDAIAMSILGPGSAAMRARLEKATERGGSRDPEDNGSDKGSEGEHEGAEAVKREGGRSSLPPGKRRRTSVDNVADASSGSTAPKASDNGVVEDGAKSGPHGGDDVKMKDDDSATRKEDDAPSVVVDPPESENAQMDVDGADGREASPAILPPPPPKAKHPNQYTYRPRNNGPAAGKPTRTSPAKKGSASSASTTGGGGGRGAVDSGSDVGSGPAASTSKRGGGAAANASGSGSTSAGGKDRAAAAAMSETPGWGLPEHLQHLKHLLPSAQPGMLAVPSPATGVTSAPASSSSSASSPPASSAAAATAAAAAAAPAATKEELATQLEPATRVRFPSKRMTMPEMKKRAKHVLEYLGRVQVELSNGRSGAAAAARESTANGEESMRLMDDLTKELMLFQQKYFGTLD